MKSLQVPIGERIDRWLQVCTHITGSPPTEIVIHPDDYTEAVKWCNDWYPDLPIRCLGERSQPLGIYA